jgi:hypothetical protein
MTHAPDSVLMRPRRVLLHRSADLLPSVGDGEKKPPVPPRPRPRQQ